MTGLARVTQAQLTGSDGKMLDCQFNPSTVTITTQGRWSAAPAPGAKKNPQSQFTGTHPSTLHANLLFDSFDVTGRPAKMSVKEAMDQLNSWVSPPPTQTAGTRQPATVRFTWGPWEAFNGVLIKVAATYTMFSPSGEPRRATADILMQAVADDPKPTNPTSGGIAGRASAVVSAADSLAAIAYREYGDAALWRAIALANGIEDPARVPIGTRVLLPPRGHAAALAAVGGGEGWT
jgi:Contractile injection system tube protein